MKTNVQYLGVIASMALLIPVLADDQAKARESATNEIRVRPPESIHAESSARIGPVMRSTKIIGSEVRNQQNDKLGKISDMVVDIESGKIVNVVVTTGGVIGIGDRQVMLSPDTFSADDDGLISLNVDKNALKKSPRFDPEAWSDEPKVGRGEISDSDVPNYRNPGKGTVFVPPVKRADSTKLATKLIGFPVKNNEGDSVGKVDNLTVDLPAGRVVQVVVAASGYLGTQDELNFVPPAAFRFNAERTVLILNVSRELLGAAPRFKNSEWPDVSDRYGSAEIYRYYQVEPYFRSEGVKVRQDQADIALDHLLRSNVEAAIRQTDGLSVNARNVQVSTHEGRLTLSGPVDSESDRQKLTDIAHRYVELSRFDSRLQVQNSAANR